MWTPLPTLTLSPTTLLIHPASVMLVITQLAYTHQACSSLTVFALAVPSVWNAFPTESTWIPSSFPSSLFSKHTFSVKPFLDTQFRISPSYFAMSYPLSLLYFFLLKLLLFNLQYILFRYLIHWPKSPVECKLHKGRELLSVLSSDAAPASTAVSGTVYPLNICWRN